LAGDAVRRLDVASSPAAAVGEGACHLRCRGAPPARPESGDTPRRGGAHQPTLVEALARSRRSSGRTREDPLAPVGEMRRGWGGIRGDRQPVGRRRRGAHTRSRRARLFPITAVGWGIRGGAAVGWGIHVAAPGEPGGWGARSPGG
jgi:hypothetical protein